MGKLGKTIAQIYWLCNHPIKLSNNFDKLKSFFHPSVVENKKKGENKKGKNKREKQNKKKIKTTHGSRPNMSTSFSTLLTLRPCTATVRLSGTRPSRRRPSLPASPIHPSSSRQCLPTAC
jgi:hypothetical protein